MKNKNLFYFASAILGSALLIVNLSLFRDSSAKPDMPILNTQVNIQRSIPEDENTVIGYAGWQNHFGSLAEMVNHSGTDLIVEVTVEKKYPARLVKFDGDTGRIAAERFNAPRGEVITDYAMNIERLFKGVSKHNKIAYIQTGGIFNGTKFKIDELPEIEEGGRYILFLREIPAQPNEMSDRSTYIINGNPQAIVKIENDKVILSPLTNKIADTTVEVYKDEIVKVLLKK